jgi:hypothetical protein
MLVATAPVAAVVPYAYPNVLGTGTATNWGVYAAIQTSNPTLRPHHTGQWTYHRVIARRPANNAFIEIGWLKDAGLGNYPRVYWVTRKPSGIENRGFYDGIILGMGVSYNYQVMRTSSNHWRAFVNGAEVRRTDLGFNDATEWASGGEAPNTSQGMGDSTHNNAQWRSPNNGPWNSTCGYEVYNPHWNVWTLHGGANCSSWRIFGNN